MQAVVQSVESVLKDNGLSVTKKRLMVFGILKDNMPLYMHELYTLCKDQLDKASLYRIINIFEELAIVQRINIGWKYKLELTDKFTEHHHHLICLKCHKIIPISESELEEFISDLSSKHKFKPAKHQIEVQGYCFSCSRE